MKQSHTEVQTINSSQVAVLDAPIDMSADAGAGLGYVDPSTLSVPYIDMVQSSSPRAKKSHEKYIPGALPGMLFNSLLGTCTSGEEGIEVIICSVQKRWNEWAPRAEKLGRPIASYPFASKEVPPYQEVEITVEGRKKKLLQTETGSTLQETDQFYVLVKNQETGTYSPAMIAMDGSDLGCSRKLTSLMYSNFAKNASGASYKIPVFGQRFQLSVGEKTTQLDTWYIWKGEYLGLVTEGQAYRMAKEFSETVEPQQLLVSRNAQHSSSTAAQAVNSANKGGTDTLPNVHDGDVPF